eukprot:TRINITY_DN2021_c0_g1_i1.p1 TRINITY_DN2021_c0_g1~~TRINITY_DN2021_c0_g1_i1.p1  ORF type:complete len:1010 (-),score=226.21 TRINITY_DN2021_c0_g1_i1:1575-4604(-)
MERSGHEVLNILRSTSLSSPSDFEKLDGTLARLRLDPEGWEICVEALETFSLPDNVVFILLSMMKHWIADPRLSEDDVRRLQDVLWSVLRSFPPSAPPFIPTKACSVLSRLHLHNHHVSIDNFIRTVIEFCVFEESAFVKDVKVEREWCVVLLRVIAEEWGAERRGRDVLNPFVPALLHSLVARVMAHQTCHNGHVTSPIEDSLSAISAYFSWIPLDLINPEDFAALFDSTDLELHGIDVIAQKLQCATEVVSRNSIPPKHDDILYALIAFSGSILLQMNSNEEFRGQFLNHVHASSNLSSFLMFAWEGYLHRIVDLVDDVGAFFTLFAQFSLSQRDSSKFIDSMAVWRVLGDHCELFRGSNISPIIRSLADECVPELIQQTLQWELDKDGARSATDVIVSLLLTNMDLDDPMKWIGRIQYMVGQLALVTGNGVESPHQASKVMFIAPLISRTLAMTQTATFFTSVVDQIVELIFTPFDAAFGLVDQFPNSCIVILQACEEMLWPLFSSMHEFSSSCIDQNTMDGSVSWWCRSIDKHLITPLFSIATCGVEWSAYSESYKERENGINCVDQNLMGCCASLLFSFVRQTRPSFIFEMPTVQEIPVLMIARAAVDEKLLWKLSNETSRFLFKFSCECTFLSPNDTDIENLLRLVFVEPLNFWLSGENQVFPFRGVDVVTHFVKAMKDNQIESHRRAVIHAMSDLPQTLCNAFSDIAHLDLQMVSVLCSFVAEFLDVFRVFLSHDMIEQCLSGAFELWEMTLSDAANGESVSKVSDIISCSAKIVEMVYRGGTLKSSELGMLARASELCLASCPVLFGVGIGGGEGALISLIGVLLLDHWKSCSLLPLESRGEMDAASLMLDALVSWIRPSAHGGTGEGGKMNVNDDAHTTNACIDPCVIREALSAIDNIQSVHNVFGKVFFRDNISVPLLHRVLESLLDGSLKTLHDDLRSIAHSLVEHVYTPFIEIVLPEFAGECAVGHVSAFSPGDDYQAFVKALDELCADVTLAKKFM